MIGARVPLPGEIEAVGRNAAEAWVRDRFLGGGDFSALFSQPHTAVIVVDDVPVAAGGFIDRGDRTSIGWTLVGYIAQQHLFAVIRKFREQIMATPFQIVEAHCFEEFPESHRWVSCIGFKPVGELHHAPDGRAFRRFVFRNHHNGN